jgi:hypothetical protein
MAVQIAMAIPERLPEAFCRPISGMEPVGEREKVC